MDLAIDLFIEKSFFTKLCKISNINLAINLRGLTALRSHQSNSFISFTYYY